MSKKTLRKAYEKELALALRSGKRKKRKITKEELFQVMADNAARATRRG